MAKTFQEITPEEFDKFAEKSPISHFQQRSDWADLKKNNGWIPHFLGVKNENELEAAVLILEKPLPMGRKMFYAPRGPLMDYEDSSLLKFTFKNLKAYTKAHHAIFLKIDPAIINLERDIDGNIVKNGQDNTKIVKTLKSLGLKHHGYNLEGNMQPQYAFVLNLKEKTEEDLLKNLKNTHRTRLRQNEKNHVSVRELKFDELDKFKKIMVSTADRRGFTDRPAKYYQDMWVALKDNLKILVAEVNLNEYKKSLEEELKPLEDQEKKLKEALKSTSHKEKIEKQLAALEKSKAGLKTREENLKSYQKSAEKDGTLTLGALLFVKTKREVTSLFGGAYGEFREFNAAYSLNWEMILESLKNGHEKYNFYGISEFKNEKNPNFGLYVFKRGFGGNVEEYIGEFDLVTSKFWYFLYKLAYELPKSLRRAKNNRKFRKSVQK